MLAFRLGKSALKVGKMLKEGQLVLFKNKPALVKSGGEKAEIRLIGGPAIKVREKDARVLHEGPLSSFDPEAAVSQAGQGDFATARQMVDGLASPTELAELVFGNSSPQAVWAVISDALSDRASFILEEGGLRPLSEEQISERARKRIEREGAEEAKRVFIERAKAALKDGKLEAAEQDARFLQEIEARATGSAAASKLLKDMKLEDSPESAHAFLLKARVKGPGWNPYPARAGLSLKAPAMVIPAPAMEGREDLTGMESFAIDNAWSKDPDDAISFSGGALWVHVADPSVSVEPGSPADREARARAATLYLPEGAVPMLPDSALADFGLGLKELSPALSFRIRLDAEGGVEDVEAMRSVVRVRRFSYQAADALLEGEVLSALRSIAERNRAKRAGNGAVEIDLPEIHLWVEGGRPMVEPSPESQSAGIVRECMLLAGEAAARYAFREGIPFPYYGQEAPAEGRALPGLAGEWAKRRLMRPGMISGSPVAHRGLGLGLYTQVTSPLRRYQDLLAHQQLGARLGGKAMMGQDDIVERTGAAQASAQAARQAERSAYQHWKLVWLLQRPDWIGKGVVLGDLGRRLAVLIPELAMETQIPADSGLAPNDEISLKVSGIDLAMLEARFQRA